MTNAAVIVAHPDDESLWCGGYILQRPTWDWFILSLCRSSDLERAERFKRVLAYLGACGAMGDLDDGPAQVPLEPSSVRDLILRRLPRRAYDCVLTHGPKGEYTRHRRHEECSQAVTAIWSEGLLDTSKLMLFAYDDNGGSSLPQAQDAADERHQLDSGIFERKRHIITQIYGFEETSWEARTTPAVETFFCPKYPQRACEAYGLVE